MIAGTLAIVVAAVLYVLVFGAAPPPLAAGVTYPAGSGLPDGFEVPRGTVQLGPVLVERQRDGSPADWTAVLAVNGDPLDAWRAFLSRLAELFPDEGIDPEALQGCSVDREQGFGCRRMVDSPRPDEGSRIVAGASLLNAPDDVTGRYLMVIEVMRFPFRPGAGIYPPNAFGPWEGGKPPPPEPARSPPAVGDPLAPSGAAYPGDTGKYVLLAGSRMVAHWGEGSVTGGFEVLLEVLPRADVNEVARAYARRANRGPAGAEVQFEYAGITYTRYPAGPGAGGYSGAIWAVDRPGEPDYVFYSLFND